MTYSAMETMFHTSGSSSSSNEEIVRYKRDIPPAHYTFRIEGFSLLLKSKVEKIESAIFEAGGYKWRLVFYPNGNTKSEGEGYISLYLAMEETKLLPSRWEVNAEIKLFVLDQKENKYLTAQDAKNGGIKHFHEMKTEAGFAKLLPLETFNDTSNYGFLSKDCCVFGAEIFVVKPSGKSECLSMVELEAGHDTFTWELEKFSTLNQEYYFSKPFTFGGKQWKLKLFPQGIDDEKVKGDWLSLYFWLCDSSTTLPPKGTVYADFKLRVLDQRRDQHVQKSTTHWFTASSHFWGWKEFIRLGNLHERSKGFVMNDTLKVQVQVNVISVTKCSK